jgi:hypothetical protein
MAKKRKVDANVETAYPTPTSFADLRIRFLSIVKLWELPLLQSLVFDKYAVPLLQLIIESDVTKKPKKKNKVAEPTLIDLLLFGTDPDAKGDS